MRYGKVQEVRAWSDDGPPGLILADGTAVMVHNDPKVNVHMQGVTKGDEVLIEPGADGIDRAVAITGRPPQIKNVQTTLRVDEVVKITEMAKTLDTTAKGLTRAILRYGLDNPGEIRRWLDQTSVQSICEHEWESEYLPDPMSLGSVVPSGAEVCRRCGAMKEER